MKAITTFYLTLFFGFITPAAFCGRISGPSLVCTGETATYSVNLPSSAINLQWSVTGGTILGSATSEEFEVQWGTSPGNGEISVYYEDGGFGAYLPVTETLKVNRQGASGGAVSSAAVCPGGSGSVTLSGHSGSIVNWQQSTNGGTNWTSLSHTSATLSFAGIQQTTQYRAVIIKNYCTVFSAAGKVIVNQIPLPAQGDNSYSSK